MSGGAWCHGWHVSSPFTSSVCVCLWGIPQPTLLDVLAPSSSKPPLKLITSIEEWVMCFNLYVALIVLKQPKRVNKLVALSIYI